MLQSHRSYQPGVCKLGQMICLLVSPLDSGRAHLDVPLEDPVSLLSVWMSRSITDPHRANLQGTSHVEWLKIWALDSETVWV